MPVHWTIHLQHYAQVIHSIQVIACFHVDKRLIHIINLLKHMLPEQGNVVVGNIL
ncbi:hypothetical protein [Arsenicibacter rosenii]|uniref:hypothetical protein n=1 Tax=Arsenicibacter rosenii TaxID=1750698 RepID=UPI0015A560DA|nr:hypothetical protein [Arsenicibacter rosenii]